MSEAAKKLEEKPNVFNYHDYREFLKDWLEHLSGAQVPLSMRQLSEAAGIAVGYLPMVIKGKRKLTKKAIVKLEPHLKLTSSEISYLICLQALADSDSQDERLWALKRMQKFSKYKRKNINEVRAYKFLTKWFYVAIREMSDLKDFNLDVGAIQNKLVFNLTKNEVREAINFLLENDYIKVDEDGVISLYDKYLGCVGNVFKVGLTQFHKEMFKLAARSIDVVPSEWRSITGHTLSISKSQFKEVREIFDNALEKISKIKNEKSSNEVVYHTSFVAFPLTKIEDDKEIPNEVD